MTSVHDAGRAEPEACPSRSATPGDEPRVRWDGFSAVRVWPADSSERAFLLENAADVWSEYPEAPEVDLVFGPRGLEMLAERGVHYEVLVEDIQAVADAERARIEEHRVEKPVDWYAEYRNFQSVQHHLQDLAEAHPDLARLQQWGGSIEGRPIAGLRITGAEPTGDAGRPGIVLNGGQHAREWISVMVTTCVAERLLTGYRRHPAVTSAMDAFEFFVVPVANPDGYVFSWEVDRYWRKNRREGFGVDLNRNYPVGWGGRGSSSNKRSQIYRGRTAFSEPESLAMWRLFETESIVAHIDFHSFSQLVLHPWNFARRPAPDRDRLAALADALASAIFSVHEKRYEVQSGAELYAAGGTMSDWAYAEAGATSFTIELRPARGGGFVLPPEQIVPTCDENFAAVLELAERVSRSASR